MLLSGGNGRLEAAMLSPSVLQDTATSEPADANSAQELTTDAEEPAEPTSADEASDTPESIVENPEAAKVPSWVDEIDAWFGTYLVKPLEATLFFDFYTGDKKDEAGNITRKGWLGTSIPFVVLWLFLGAIFFTCRMGLINVRGFWHALRLTKGDYDDPNDTGEVSHFQALASALSATVGLGNIAGVAIAISIGGPGATVWMIIIGLLGMSTKFTECSLGQMYRKVMPDGTVSGGPMRYLKDGLSEMGLKPLGAFLAVVFALLCIGASFGGGNAFQVVQSMNALKSDPALSILNEYPWVYGLVMAVMVGLVIVGGIKSIGKVAGRIVPFMCAAYVAAAITILVKNATQIPDAISLMINGATNLDAGIGGLIGVAVVGIQRAVFSNEAGAGSAAIAHSAAKTEEPISEGIVALLEPFIDTVVICTMTALVIVITGVYDPSGEFKQIIANNDGAALTAHAFTQGGYDWFKWILYAAVVLFAYSTMISWSYYGERCWTTLFGLKSSAIYKALFLIFTFLGSIVTAKNILSFSDILILGMALPNILGLLFLSGKVKRELDRYWKRYKSGEFDREN